MYIKANEELFNSWRHLGMKVSDCAAVVQNNIQLTQEEIDEFKEITTKINAEFQLLVAKTEYYLNSNILYPRVEVT